MFKFMIKIHEGAVEISLSSAWEQPGKFTLDGPDEAVSVVRDWLNTAIGSFGHFAVQGGEAMPSDIFHACLTANFPIVSAKMIEGEALPVSSPPQGTCS